MVKTVVQRLADAVEPLRWRKHRRERAAAVEIERLRLRLERQQRKEEAAERQRREDADRQVQLIESLFDNLRDIDERRSGDLKALAAGVTKQAEGFQEWIKLFAQTPGDPKSTTVRDADELLEEQQRWAEMLAQAGYPVHGSPEEQLNFILNDE